MDQSGGLGWREELAPIMFGLAFEMGLSSPELGFLPLPDEKVGNALLGEVVAPLPDDEFDVPLPLSDENFD